MDNFIYNKNLKIGLKIKNGNCLNTRLIFLNPYKKKKNKQYLISSEVGTGKTITAFLPFFQLFY